MVAWPKLGAKTKLSGTGPVARGLTLSLAARRSRFAAAIDLLLRKVGDKERLERYRALAWRNGLYASIIVAVFVFNFLFYTGHIPSSSRYDFPGILALPALLILLLKSAGETAGVFGFGVVARKTTGLVLAILLVVHTARAPWILPSAEGSGRAQFGVR